MPLLRHEVMHPITICSAQDGRPVAALSPVGAFVFELSRERSPMIPGLEHLDRCTRFFSIDSARRLRHALNELRASPGWGEDQDERGSLEEAREALRQVWRAMDSLLSDRRFCAVASHSDIAKLQDVAELCRKTLSP